MSGGRQRLDNGILGPYARLPGARQRETLDHPKVARYFNRVPYALFTPGNRAYGPSSSETNQSADETAQFGIIRDVNLDAHWHC